MRGVVARHRSAQAVLGAIAVEPAPHGTIGAAVLAGDVDRLAVTVAADARLAAMQRVAGARLEARRQALTVVVAERAEKRPANAGGVHRTAGVIELLAEIRIHAADHIDRHRHSKTLGRGRVLPGEIAGRVPLARRPPID